MSLYPFITWYPDNHSIVRGHGLNEDTKYLAGDKPARYPVPAIRYHVKWYPNSWIAVFKSRKTVRTWKDQTV